MVFSAVFLWLQTFFSPNSSFSAEVVERILAVVNDEIITEQDLQVIMAPIVAQYRTMYTGAKLEEELAAAAQNFLDKVIEDKLILSEAKRKQVIIKDAEVDEMMTDVRNKFPSRDLFLSAIEEQGLTEKKLWNRFRDQIMMQKLVNFEVRSRVSVSPGEINEYYKANPDRFAQGDRVHLQQILVRIGQRSEEEAKSFTDSLLARLIRKVPKPKRAAKWGGGGKGSFWVKLTRRYLRLAPVKSRLSFEAVLVFIFLKSWRESRSP